MNEVLRTAEVWRTAQPHEALSWFSHLTVPWWIAGGQALDLFVGQQTRIHGDLDVGVLRKDVGEVLRILPSWEVFEAKDGRLTRLPVGSEPRSDVNGLWCRPAHSSLWVLELMLDRFDQGSWVFRREPTIRRSIATLTRRSADGIPYLAPEIQLLYKARQIRPQDQVDFDCIAPLLDPEARAWLQTALHRAEPDHPWIARLNP